MPGASLCVSNLNIVQKQFEEFGREALKEWGLQVLARAKEMCPVDTGKLRRSGNLKIQKNTITFFQIQIGFYTNYAAVVHEVPMQHDIGSMKYLATPFNLKSHLLIKSLESKMRAAL